MTTTRSPYAKDYLPQNGREVDWHGLRKPFDKAEVSRLPSSAKRPALDYVSHAAVTNRLNLSAPGWTYRIEPVVVRGSVVVEDRHASFVPDESGLPHVIAVFGEMTIGGVSRQEVGEVDSFSTYGLELKNAISDFIRRAAMRFGVALDLWSKEELSSGESTATSTAGQPSRPGMGGRAQAGPNWDQRIAQPASPVTSEPGTRETFLGSGPEPGGPVEKAGPPGSQSASEGGESLNTGGGDTPPSHGDDLAGMTLAELTELGTKRAGSRNRFRQWVNETCGTHYKVTDFEMNVTHEELEAGVRRIREFGTKGSA